MKITRKAFMESMTDYFWPGNNRANLLKDDEEGDIFWESHHPVIWSWIRDWEAQFNKLNPDFQIVITKAEEYLPHHHAYRIRRKTPKYLRYPQWNCTMRDAEVEVTGKYEEESGIISRFCTEEDSDAESQPEAESPAARTQRLKVEEKKVKPDDEDIETLVLFRHKGVIYLKSSFNECWERGPNCTMGKWAGIYDPAKDVIRPAPEPEFVE